MLNRKVTLCLMVTEACVRCDGLAFAIAKLATLGGVCSQAERWEFAGGIRFSRLPSVPHQLP